MTRARSGFTLLELVVATAILSIGLVALAQVFSRGLRSTGSSEKVVSATLIDAFLTPTLFLLFGRGFCLCRSLCQMLLTLDFLPAPGLCPARQAWRYR